MAAWVKCVIIVLSLGHAGNQQATPLVNNGSMIVTSPPGQEINRVYRPREDPLDEPPTSVSGTRRRGTPRKGANLDTNSVQRCASRGRADQR
jgi:hypothetical protein